MEQEKVFLPDGTEFPFWDDETQYTKTYHVAQRQRGASDDNPGTAARPFKTIGRAAALLLPSERVVVHAGVYRECVQPARGGDGPALMIAYQAARGDEVVIRASDVWKPDCVPATDWEGVPEKVWFAELPREWFHGYNPFQTPLMPYLPWFPWVTRPHEEIQRALAPRGRLFQDGRPVKMVTSVGALGKEPGAFCVSGDGTRLFFRLHDDARPEDVTLELTVRLQCFAPAVLGLGYIRVSGFRMEHAANGVPMPQRGALSPSAGHHWIIERNTVRYATATGMDVGWQGDVCRRRPAEQTGGHIVRRNVICDCGISGISGTRGTERLLIEENIIERIGGMALERCYEAAGIKLHFARHTLLRRNVIRHNDAACGIWLDYLCGLNRLSGNVIADIQTLLAGIYIEADLEAHVVDGNFIWDMRDVPGNTPPKDGLWGGLGVSSDVSDHTIIAHNFIGKVRDSYGMGMHLAQKGRVSGSRSAAGTGHKALNNFLVQTPKRVLLDNLNGNTADGNLYDARNDSASLTIRDPLREARYNLEAWQRYFGFDRNGAQAQIEAQLDPDALKLTLKLSGPVPQPQPVAELHGEERYAGAGPFDAATWKRLAAGKTVVLRLGW